jgi:hypothetical protein
VHIAYGQNHQRSSPSSTDSKSTGATRNAPIVRALRMGVSVPDGQWTRRKIDAQETAQTRVRTRQSPALHAVYVPSHVLTRWAAHMDPYTLAYLAGHSDSRMTRRYVHPQADTVRAAMERAPAAGGGHSFGRSGQNANTAASAPNSELVDFRRGLVGASGFEPPASWSRTRRSSQAEPRPEQFYSSKLRK